MSTREILSLQFGHYANYVGTHFWNIQELSFDYTGANPSECNHDILYREGRNMRNEVTYTPRLILADLKGSLKTLPETGGLYQPLSDEIMEWPEVEKVEAVQYEKNEYLEDIEMPSTSEVEENKKYDLEKQVNTWTDYLYSRFHHRTVNIVNEYQSGNEQAPFNAFPTGRNMWNSSDYSYDFSDNIRKYVEECDSLQGFNVTFDSTDAFAGLALGCIEHIADEYSKTILAYPLIASHFVDNIANNQEERDKSNKNDSIRLVNHTLALQSLSEYANLFVPLCTGEMGWRKPGNPRHFENVKYDPQLYYHTSAILASAMDTLSLKYRQKDTIFTLSDICADMTGYGRRMAAASLGLPFSMNESEYLIDYLDKTEKPIYSCITPSCKIATDKIFQLITVRGIPELKLKLPAKKALKQIELPAYRCSNVKEMFELYFQSSCFLSATNVTVAQKPLELKTPFPEIFSDNLNRNGYVKQFVNEERAESVPVIAGYHNGAFIADSIEKVHREAKRIKIAKLHVFSDEGLESSEFTECLDKLEEFKDNYEENYEL